jgi:hypothetical protein
MDIAHGLHLIQCGCRHLVKAVHGFAMQPILAGRCWLNQCARNQRLGSLTTLLADHPQLSNFPPVTLYTRLARQCVNHGQHLFTDPWFPDHPACRPPRIQLGTTAAQETSRLQAPNRHPVAPHSSSTCRTCTRLHTCSGQRQGMLRRWVVWLLCVILCCVLYS